MTPSEQITNYISQRADWRGEMLADLRKVILEAAPELQEEWQRKFPVWTCNGNVVVAAAFKNYVKLNFFKGASLDDPKGLFNAGLGAKKSRAIDFREGNAIDAAALKDLIRAAIAQNAAERQDSVFDPRRR
jgi:hypothetical protein